VILERTKDLELIKAFMMQPEIFRVASEDSASAEQEFTAHDREIWMFAIKDSVAVGIVHSHLENGTTAWFHPYIMKSHKKDYLILIKVFLQWFDKYFPIEVQKLNAHVPTYAKQAYKATINAGFKDEGLNRLSFMKNGKLWNRHLVGYIRGESYE
jgi:hypothetical protein